MMALTTLSLSLLSLGSTHILRLLIGSWALSRSSTHEDNGGAGSDSTSIAPSSQSPCALSHSLTLSLSLSLSLSLCLCLYFRGREARWRLARAFRPATKRPHGFLFVLRNATPCFDTCESPYPYINCGFSLHPRRVYCTRILKKAQH
jgi:hypothetical protein